jgi:hypothetical protein
MRRGLALVFLLACGKRDDALDAVGRAQVLDIDAADKYIAFTAHLERKGARWNRRLELLRPISKPLMKRDPQKGDDSRESPATDAFLRVVAKSHRGSPNVAPGAPGTVKITVNGPAGAAPVVLERKDDAKWTVDGATLADPGPIDASWRAVVTEIGVDDAVAWQLSGPAY